MKRSRDVARVAKVLSVEARVRIVGLVRGQALCVNALAARLGLTPGAVSQHLRVMRDAGLVRAEKRGYYVHYRLNEATMAGWREAVNRLLDPETGAGENTKGAGTCAAATTRSKAARSRRT